MKTRFWGLVSLCWAFLLQPFGVQPAPAQDEMDIAPFAKRCCVDDRHISQVVFDIPESERAGTAAEGAQDGRFIYGLQWGEERDVREVRVHFKSGSALVPAEVEYWFHNWPYPQPGMPAIEDPEQDPWQGKWLKAAVQADCGGAECRYTFKPILPGENPLANNLRGVDYRRTLKVRLVFHDPPALNGVQVFTGTKIRPVEVRVQLGAGEQTRYDWKGTISIYNGFLKSATLWNGSADDSLDSAHFLISTKGAPKGFLLKIDAAEPSLPGSEEVTMVTFKAGERTFTFAVPDLERRPIYVPAFHTYVTYASDVQNYSPSIVKTGGKIRERIPKEPEQSFEQASKEIPPLDPTSREIQESDRLYVPLAVESSWQKFALEWGGNVRISKVATKAKGSELNRLEWMGDRISWRIGTGATPDFRPGWKDSSLTTVGALPIINVAWSNEGIAYTEESFATLLSGPLSPRDPERSEQTPAVLLLKISAKNTASQAVHGHLWLATDPDELVTYSNHELLAGHGELVRAHLKLPGSTQVSTSNILYGARYLRGIHLETPLGPQEERTFFIALPFIPRLNEAQRARIAELAYDQERKRVADYWQEIIAKTVPFDVPEENYMKLARAMAPHLLISVIKDPKSGLYVVGGASYLYDVFTNAASQDSLVLDLLGDHQRATEYLETFMRLQGTRPMLGTFSGDQSGLYHGGRIDPVYDYSMGEYNLDHGRVLTDLAEHYLYTRDQDWLRHAAPSLEKAADWIVAQRQLTKVTENGEKVPEYGLLPAGALEDNPDWGHWFGVNAEASAGMTRLAQALQDLGVPEAPRYAQEAVDYRNDVREAAIRAAQAAPVVQVRDNTYIPYVPTRTYQRIRHHGPLRAQYYLRYPVEVYPLYRLAATREPFSGSILLSIRDVFGPNEPMTDWMLDDWEDNATMSTSLGINVHGWVDDRYWFSRGGMVFESPRNPALVYLRRNEVPAAIRSLMNSFVAQYYPGANEFTEEYHQWVHGLGPFYKIVDEVRWEDRLRAMLVREDGDELWLAAGTPRRWLEPGKHIAVHEAPSFFGPVNYKLESSESLVKGTVTLPARNKFGSAWLVVRYPDNKTIKSVEINGKPWKDFDAAAQRIHLPVETQPMQILVHF